MKPSWRTLTHPQQHQQKAESDAQDAQHQGELIAPGGGGVEVEQVLCCATVALGTGMSHKGCSAHSFSVGGLDQ